MAHTDNQNFAGWLSRSKRLAGPIGVYGILILPLTYVLVRLLYQSMNWRITHDSPILFYMGFLMDRFGFVPHRDFFDMNLIGSYFAYSTIGHLFGYTGSTLRYADLICMGLIAVFVALAFRRFGVRAVWMALLVFLLRYLQFGPVMAFQREYLMLIPLSAALAAAFAFPKASPLVRAGWVGFFFGLAASIKPHAVVGMPVLLVYLFLDAPGRSFGRRAFEVALASAAGIAIPILAVVIYLAVHGALDDFLSIAFNYGPLYWAISGNRTVMEDAERSSYLLSRLIALGGHRELVFVGVFGAAAASWRCLEDPSIRRQCAALAGLIAAYALYPVFSGHFWTYHWIPLVFFSALGVGLCFSRLPPGTPLLFRIVPPVLALLIVISILDPQRGASHVFRDRENLPKNGRPDAIANFLKENLEAGDTVQPLDWTGTGVIHGMLLAEAKIATPFVYTFHFYHHVSTDYITALRKRFLDSLAEEKPRYVIEGKMTRPFVYGKDVAYRFSALENWLHREYTPVVAPSWNRQSMRLNARTPNEVKQREGYIIWERKRGDGLDKPQASIE